VAYAFMLATNVTNIGIGRFFDFPCLKENKIRSQGSADDDENDQKPHDKFLKSKIQNTGVRIQNKG
jgi:hypothetical protein